MSRLFTNDTITIDRTAGLETPSTAVTIGGWFYPTNSPGNYQRLFGKHIGGVGVAPYVSWNLQQFSTSTRQLEFNVGLTSNVIYSSGTASALSTNTWYFVSGRWSSGNSPEIRIFSADGTLFSSNSGSTASGAIDYDSNEDVQFTDGGDGGSKIDGRCAMFFISSSSWSDDAIRNFMFSGRTSNTLQLLMTMDKSTEADYSGNGNTINVTGTALADNPPMKPIFGIQDESVSNPTAVAGNDIPVFIKHYRNQGQL